MAVTDFSFRTVGSAGLSLQNSGRGRLGFDIQMVPHPLIIAAQMVAWAHNVSTFRVPLKEAVDKVMAPSFRKNFEVGGRPSWEPLSEATIGRRESEGFEATPVLVRSGTLKGVAGDPNIWTVGDEEAYVSDLRNAAYGGVHQSGGGDVPARPWALIQDEDVDAVEEVFVEWFSKHMDHAGFRVFSV